MNRAYRLVADRDITHQALLKARIVAAEERLGECLLALSAQLQASGFLDDDASRAAYESVVATFGSLSASVRWLDKP
jgi:hypothetical protein